MYSTTSSSSNVYIQTHWSAYCHSLTVLSIALTNICNTYIHDNSFLETTGAQVLHASLICIKLECQIKTNIRCKPLFSTRRFQVCLLGFISHQQHTINTVQLLIYSVFLFNRAKTLRSCIAGSQFSVQS